MKKLIITSLSLLALVAGAFTWAATAIYVPDGGTAGTTSIMIAASPGHRVTNAWATATAYSQGDYTLSTNGQVYWCVSAGTTTSAVPPIISDGIDYLDEAVVWQRVRRARNWANVVNISTSWMYLAHNNDAVVYKGIAIAPNGGSWSPPDREGCPQGSIHAVFENNTTNKYTIQEW